MEKHGGFKIICLFLGALLLTIFCLPGQSGAQYLEEAERLNKQAVQLYRQGRYQEAIAPAKRALAIKEKALGPEHPDVALGLNNLAGLYDDLGDYAGAEPLFAAEFQKPCLAQGEYLSIIS